MTQAQLDALALGRGMTRKERSEREWEREGSGQPTTLHATTRHVLQFIREFMAVNDGYAPNMQEIKDGCNLSSKSMAHYHVHLLSELHVLSIDPGLSPRIVLRERA